MVNDESTVTFKCAGRPCLGLRSLEEVCVYAAVRSASAKEVQ